MQIFGSGNNNATSLMLRVYGGALTFYRKDTLIANCYDKWYRLNVTHNAPTREIKVYINNELKYTCQAGGDNPHYFKCGVYNQDGAAFKNEAKFKNIKIWKKESTK